MRIRRCYTPQPLAVDQQISLDERNLHHLANVLRVRQGDACILFNGDGYEYQATLLDVSRQQIIAGITKSSHNPEEPQRKITLVQAIAKGERMDWIMQKATELGVHAIQPLMTLRTTVQLSGHRLQKRLTHWQTIAIGACEQCGRTTLPKVHQPLNLKQISLTNSQVGIVLHPNTNVSLQQAANNNNELALFIGPEGGFDQQEVSWLNNAGNVAATLGTRILRTETAALAALAVLNLTT